MLGDFWSWRIPNAASESGSSARAQQHEANEEIMSDEADWEIADEYDFSGGVRGKYAARYAQGTNIVRLDADVAAMFPDSAAVNEALRGLGQIIRRQAELAPNPSR
ncbi:MAG TPA: hypothetical protein VF665_16190 [Longimicrobium sp.]|jgi:hypothetical protein|uniref:hypothetical protein n=1 Tax=Longimicrobium sp. TaxID=2029185 RepID=UPI002ED84347